MLRRVVQRVARRDFGGPGLDGARGWAVRRGGSVLMVTTIAASFRCGGGVASGRWDDVLPDGWLTFPSSFRLGCDRRTFRHRYPLDCINRLRGERRTEAETAGGPRAAARHRKPGDQLGVRGA